MREQDVTAVVLPDTEHRDILTSRILPAWTKGAVRQERPVVVFVAGQPGSGKSSVADLIHQVLGRRGGAVRVSSDLYKTLHPFYSALMAEDDRTAGVKVRPDTRRWQAGVEAHVRRHRFDAVVETALTDPAGFRTAAAAYRAAGFRIDVVTLATPEALSQLSVLDRYLQQIHTAGAGRHVSWENHDSACCTLLETLNVIEAEHLADHLTVVRRGADVLYRSEPAAAAGLRAAASTTTAATAVSAVSAERARPWTARETLQFRHGLSRAEQRLHHPRVTYGQGLAVRGDAERAFALAEPVRRIAQARTEPPGVDYHRLSAAEHRWIFDELIVPSYLNPITAQDRPVAVYVMGQPGSGKSRAANLVQRALQNRDPVRIVGEDFKAHHPDYLQLLRDNPRAAGASIRADYRAWMSQAEAYVRAHRGDVVIEMAPGSAEDFLRSAVPYRQAGYRVELVVLAVRAADSRQGTAHRFALVQDSGMPARFTSASGHDRCYRAVAEAVQAAEDSGAVDSLVVIRRDATAVYGGERSPGGHLEAVGAGVALAVERQRPYTQPEAAEFLAVHRRLRTNLPQYRAELDQIAQLARPLLPADLQPQRLTEPGGPAALPVPAPHGAAAYCVSSR